MKKIFILLIGLGIIGCATDSNPPLKKIHKKVSVLDKGIVRKIDIVYDEDKQQDIEKQGFIIKFDKQMSARDISLFEKENDLKLKKKLHAGYYVFEKETSDSMFDVLDKLIKKSQNISTIRPNVELNMQPR
jgi:hypothetical protein